LKNKKGVWFGPTVGPDGLDVSMATLWAKTATGNVAELQQATLWAKYVAIGVICVDRITLCSSNHTLHLPEIFVD